MKVMHIVASIRDEAAGPSISVPRLAEALSRSGANVEIATVGNGEKKGGWAVPHVQYRQDFSQTPVLSRLAISSSMRRAILAQADSVDIFHTHGLWKMPNVYPASAAGPAVFVISPRGMLGEAALAFSPFRKRVFWNLWQKRAAETASLFHVTSEQEAEEVRAQGLRAPIVISPNGIDIPPLSPIIRPSSPRTVLSLGRVHPKKGLDRLLYAWHRVAKDRLDWRLRIVGPSELNHADALRALALRLELRNVVIEGPLFGAEKLAAYQQACLFILATLNENFAMTVAEALAAGTPVVSTKGAPWAGLVSEGCGWWVDHGPEALASALVEVFAMTPERLSEMGALGRAWMIREFSWDHVAVPLMEAYGVACRGRRGRNPVQPLNMTSSETDEV